MSIGLFFENETTRILTETVEKEYGKKIAREIIPFGAKASKGDNSMVQYVIDSVGYMELKKHISDDFELSDISKEEIAKILYVSETGFQYNINEIWTAMEKNISLDGEKVKSCMKNYEDLINRTAFVGQANLGLTGLANNAYVDINTDMGATFAVATSEQRIKFFSNLCGDVLLGSKDSISPDILVIPSEEYTAMALKTYSNSGVVTDKSELETLQTRINGLFGSVRIVSSYELEGQGAGGVQRAVAYKNDEEVLYYEETLPIQFGNRQERNNFYSVPAVCKVGGVWVRRPYGMQYGDYTKA